jgi:hypothetical protein
LLDPKKSSADTPQSKDASHQVKFKQENAGWRDIEAGLKNEIMLRLPLTIWYGVICYCRRIKAETDSRYAFEVCIAEDHEMASGKFKRKS